MTKPLQPAGTIRTHTARDLLGTSGVRLAYVGGVPVGYPLDERLAAMPGLLVETVFANAEGETVFVVWGVVDMFELVTKATESIVVWTEK